MKPPRVRISVRTMMIAVAVVAALLGWQEERRSRFRGAAIAHERERNTLQVNDLGVYLLVAPCQGEPDEAFAERTRAARPVERFTGYHSQMAEKYERASERPWLPVAPDPPPPPKPSREYVKVLLARYRLDDPEITPLIQEENASVRLDRGDIP